MGNLLLTWRNTLSGPSTRPVTALSWRRMAIECIVLGLVYSLAARIGLAYSSLAPNVTLIWPPTGISLFAVLRWGPYLWPGIVLGDLIANADTGASLWAILGISCGNVLQTLACAWALRGLGFQEDLQRVRDVVALLSLGTTGAALSAFIGPAALALSGSFPWPAYPSVWLQWLMGDATGVVVFTPLLLAWWRPGGSPFAGTRRLEGAALLLLLLVLCEAIFGRLFDAAMPLAPGYYPSSLALFPLAVWASLRFGLRGATLLTLVVSMAAVWGTVHGWGPFVDGVQTSSLLRWWMFANVITVTSLLLCAAQSERDQARLEAIRDRDFGNAILDAEGSIVVVLDADWRIQRVNRAFETITGFALADLAGQRFEQALIPADQHAKFTGHAELLRLNLSASARHDSQLRRRRGPPLTMSWSTSVLRDAQGRIAHAIVSGVDVSARVEAAEALRHARRQLQDRVTERTRDLATANADLQVQMAERQRLEREIIRISEYEQQRFGQELHDGLGQHLTAAAIQAELLARDLEAAGQPGVQQAAQQIETMLSDAVAQARLLARALFPVEVEDGGLAAALRQLADNTQQRLRRPCTLDCPLTVEVRDHTLAIHLYRIAQEAVNNATKHAPGAPIQMALHSNGTYLRLTVRNPLPEVSEDAVQRDKGMGLRIMRHRAHLVGASLQAGADGDCWVVDLSVAPSTTAEMENSHAARA